MARPFVELYINNQKVYFKEPPEIFVTYAHTDLHNPTVVKNSYTKTITVEGTPENNRIFNNFYDMKRMNGDGLFNPSRKEIFTLYRNGEPIENGYVKLDKVNKKNGRITYDITLYGGLGQFLYNLQYKDDGEQMKLSDLEYNTDFNFTVDRNTIKGAWQHITDMKEVENGELYDVINFAPCYNGIPEDFAADKVAIDIESFKNEETIYNSFIKKKDGYTTVDGWMIAELEKEYDEWQVGDLRSYLQRPVFRFKEIIKACCNPNNNGGYFVDLDSEFFNENNQYYENAWMTLPLITEMDSFEDNGETIIDYNNGIFSIDNTNFGGKIRFEVPFVLTADSDIAISNDFRRLFTGVWSNILDVKSNTAYYVQLVAYNSNDVAVAGSNVLSFYTSVGTMSGFKYELEYDAPITEIKGDFFRLKDEPNFKFEGEQKLGVDVTFESGMYFKLVIKQSVIEEFSTGFGGILFTSTSSRALPITDAKIYADLNVNNVVLSTEIKMGKKMNKQKLLNSENTPCDYFLSYIKMFNLHIWKDMYENKIYVRQRKNFFSDEIKDIEEWIDRGDDITIKPLTFENKWLNFIAEYEQDEKLHKNYKDNYGLEYGIQKVDTNYSFDSSSKDILENYVFKGCITSRNKSKYYLALRDDGDDVPSYYLDGFQTYLFNGNGDTTEGTKITPKTVEIIRDWWKEKYYDFMPKPNFTDNDNKAVEGANVLLFYNGPQLMKDINGETLNIRITDDIPQFEIINDGEPCWIWTADNQKAVSFYNNGYIPKFSRYITNENGWVTHSWDFGTPKALYIPDYNIDETSSIYTQYWKPYIRDQYDSNTRVVECKVLLKERVIGDWLQRFYYWDGRYWVLNKITDYNPASNDTTKCEFISVNNINNYMS